MERKIINIDEEKCNGCGLCITACHEGAIQMVNGKAKLISDSYCDGLGDCLPACPMGAIEIIVREANSFDEEQVKEMLNKKKSENCLSIRPKSYMKKVKTNLVRCELNQWPCQLKLVPNKASYFNNDLLIAADCTAFTYPNIHGLMKSKTTVIACPKLDEFDYTDKLTDIINLNDVKKITVVRMEVPCCGGLEFFVKKSIENSEKNIKVDVITISMEGNIMYKEEKR